MGTTETQTETVPSHHMALIYTRGPSPSTEAPWSTVPWSFIHRASPRSSPTTSSGDSISFSKVLNAVLHTLRQSGFSPRAHSLPTTTPGSTPPFWGGLRVVVVSPCTTYKHELFTGVQDENLASREHNPAVLTIKPPPQPHRLGWHGRHRNGHLRRPLPASTTPIRLDENFILPKRTNGLPRGIIARKKNNGEHHDYARPARPRRAVRSLRSRTSRLTKASLK